VHSSLLRHRHLTLVRVGPEVARKDNRIIRNGAAMLQTATPLALFHQQIRILRTHLPGALDGRPDSIHDARIATRRIREVLPLAHEWQRRDVADDLFARFQRMGRSLGRVRDADVRIELLKYLESRISNAAPSLVLVRQRKECARRELMRRLVKRFERLAAERELARLAAGAPRHRPSFWFTLTSPWRSQLRLLLAERAHGATDAIAHAGRLYFPNRTHEARIAIKKFRYAAEIAERAGIVAGEPLIRDLKKSSDILGELHDRQTLIDDLNDGAILGDGMDEIQIRCVAQLVEAEIDDLHRRFLDRQPYLAAACQRTLRELDGGVVTKGACAVAGVVALAAGIEATRRRQTARPLAPDPEHLPLQNGSRVGEPGVAAVSVRVPVALQEMHSR
jgi:CHAD domain-containing protein